MNTFETKKEALVALFEPDVLKKLAELYDVDVDNLNKTEKAALGFRFCSDVSDEFAQNIPQKLEKEIKEGQTLFYFETFDIDDSSAIKAISPIREEHLKMSAEEQKKLPFRVRCALLGRQCRGLSAEELASMFDFLVGTEAVGYIVDCLIEQKKSKSK